MLHAAGRIAFLALGNSPFQMLDALLHVHVGFLFLRRLGVHQRRFGMLHQDIRMALLPCEIASSVCSTASAAWDLAAQETPLTTNARAPKSNTATANVRIMTNTSLLAR